MPLHKNRLTRKKHAPNIDLMPVMTGSKPWYQSLTILSAIAGLLNVVAMVFKIEVTKDEIQEVISAVIAVIATVGVVIGRKRATKEVTLTDETPSRLLLLCLVGASVLLLPACNSINEGPGDSPQVSPFVGQRTAIGGEIVLGDNAIGLALTWRRANADDFAEGEPPYIQPLGDK